MELITCTFVEIYTAIFVTGLYTRNLVSQAIRIFPRGAHAQGKGGGEREGKVRLVTCTRFSFRNVGRANQI